MCPEVIQAILQVVSLQESRSYLFLATTPVYTVVTFPKDDAGGLLPTYFKLLLQALPPMGNAAFLQLTGKRSSHSPQLHKSGQELRGSNPSVQSEAQSFH